MESYSYFVLNEAERDYAVTSYLSRVKREIPRLCNLVTRLQLC